MYILAQCTPHTYYSCTYIHITWLLVNYCKLYFSFSENCKQSYILINGLFSKYVLLYKEVNKLIFEEGFNFSGLSENLGMCLKQVNFNYAYQLLSWPLKKLWKFTLTSIGLRKDTVKLSTTEPFLLSPAFINYP